MIELLTPPAKSGPVQPGAKGASGASGGIDFAALFGTVDPVTGEPSVTVATDGTAATTSATASATPTLADISAIVLPMSTPTDAVAAPVVDAKDAVAATTGPASTVDPAVATVPVATPSQVAPSVATDDAPALDLPVAPPVSLAGKPMTIKPHGPVVTEDETVKLPTLPADFVAQKAPRAQSTAGDDGDDKDEASDEAAVAPEIPAPTPPTVMVAPPVVADATPIAVPVTSPKRASAVATAKIDDKPTDAIKSADTSTIAGADVGQVISTDSGTAVHGVVTPAPSSADPGNAQVAQPALTPTLPIDGPKAAPIDTSATPIASRQSVALDDLMVAGAGDSAWLDRLSSDITTLARGDAREAHMKINPRSLGDMSIRLEMDGQNTRVHFTVDTQQAATLISDGTQKLMTLVQTNGLKLDGATVDLSQRRGDGRPSDQGQQQQRQADVPTPFNRSRSETARMIERTRIAVATERFA